MVVKPILEKLLGRRSMRMKEYLRELGSSEQGGMENARYAK